VRDWLSTRIDLVSSIVQANKRVSTMNPSDPIVALITTRIDLLVRQVEGAMSLAEVGDLAGATTALRAVADKSLDLVTTIRTIGDE
jgi:hypothetical protein